MQFGRTWLFLLSAFLIGCHNDKASCTKGASIACACVDGKMGAQTCQGDGTYNACECEPDDLSAHYILSIVYRRLGMQKEASREATAFADQKDDPTANVYALEFLRKHPEVTAESVPWHVHRDRANESAPTAGGSGQ